MSPRALNVILLAALTSLPLLHASNLRAGSPPLPTAAAMLFMRQDGYTCDAGMTACTDGSGGCCDIGAPCGFENGIPICEEGCGAGPTCTGILDGLCCNLGYTCNYQSTLCESDFGGGGGGGGGGGTLTDTFPTDSLTESGSFPTPTTSVAPLSTPSLLPSPTVTDTFPSDTLTPVSSLDNTEISTPSTNPFTFPSISSVPTPTIIGGGVTTTTGPSPGQSVAAAGQSKLTVGMKLLLAVQGLNFFWA